MAIKTQLYRNSKSTIFKDKDSALAFLKDVAIKDASIKDGEPFLVRYYDKDGSVKSLLVTAYVDGENRSFTLASDGTNGKAEIVESETEPEDKSVLWLQPQVTQDAKNDLVNDEAVSFSDIRSLYAAVAELTKVVNRHEYAFAHVMDSGTIENSERLGEMSGATAQKPDLINGTEPKVVVHYNNSGMVTAVINHYVSSTVESGLTIDQESGWTENFVESYYDTDKPYMWNYKTFNIKNGLPINSEPTLISVFDSGSTDVTSITDYYYATEQEDGSTPEKTSELWKTDIPSPFTTGETYLWSYTICNFEYTNQVKPAYDEYQTPNLKHLLIKSAETEKQIQEHIKDILVHEMIFCEANNGLYMKTRKGKLVRLNGTSTINNDNKDPDNDKEEIMEEIKTLSGGISSMTFISVKGNKYNAKMSDDGELKIYSSSLDTPIAEPTGKASGKSGDLVTDLFLPKLYINSFYCGGNDSNPHNYKMCSHNFVELSNLTTSDINLNGLYLYYSSDGAIWDKLALWGEIKSGNTFLIRGSQCSVMESDTTVVKVRDCDMEWVDGDNLMSFANDKGAFYLTYDSNPPSVNPYQASASGIKVLYGYIDLVGFGTINVAENKSFKLTEGFNDFSDVLMRKYYSMDNVSQATKALAKRNNSNDWYFVDLRKDGVIPYKSKEKPYAAKDKKDLFYNKSALYEKKPTLVNVSFGIQATAGTTGATRCFNWVSEGYSDEYLFYRLKGSSSFTRVESVTEANHNDSNSYADATLAQHYYRQQHEATNGQVFTTHKLIVRGLAKGEYEYYVGKSNDDGTPNVNACIGLNKFTVRADADVASSFRFVQTSDQQGFNWDEYQVWKYTADWIKDKYSDVQFMINTGDMTQNGNRVNEWIDYFNGKEKLKDIEELATVGNNDLCPAIEYELGNGGDASKLNAVNLDFFYCFEMNPNNPPKFGIGDTTVYVPSLYSFNYGNVHFICVNSEITEKTETDVFNLADKKGAVYAEIKKWCEKDLTLNSGKVWNVAYCHEMPFTIITQAVVNNRFDKTKEPGKQFNTSSTRGGSHLNTVTTADNSYWFSKFCQTHDIRLVMGGHKHTQAVSYPLIETDDSMNPTIQVDTTLLNEFSGATSLSEVTSGELKGRKYPNTWVTNGVVNDDISVEAHICNFELVSNITAPVYAMSQASGYKHTSNKELPSPHIPWLRGYFGATNEGTVVNNGQRAPFFTIWDITPSKIVGNVRKLTNIFESKGKFNIQIQGEAIKNGTVSIIEVNGFKDGSENTDLHLEINK